MAVSISLRVWLMIAISCMACLFSAGCTGNSSGVGRSGRSESSGRTPLAEMTAPQALAAGLNGMVLASTVVASGRFSQPSGNLDFHLSYVRSTGCTGTVDGGTYGHFSMVVIGKTVWAGGNRTFWNRIIGEQLPEVVPLLVGKYLKTPASDPIATMGRLCNTKYLASLIFPPRDLSRGAETTFDGQRVLPLISKKGGGTVYVTDSGTPRILALVNTSAQHKAALTFVYGVRVNLVAPPVSDTLDCAKYGC